MKRICNNKKLSVWKPQPGKSNTLVSQCCYYSCDCSQNTTGVVRCAQLNRPRPRPRRRTQILALRNKQMKARTDLTGPLKVFLQNSKRNRILEWTKDFNGSEMNV